MDSGTCTAIWSPSKSALNAAQTSGCSWIALPSISTGSNAWMPRRWSVGARFSNRVLADHLLEDVPDLRRPRFDELLRLLDGRRRSRALQACWMMNGLNSSSAIFFGDRTGAA